jgi:hypothetical protein
VFEQEGVGIRLVRNDARELERGAQVIADQTGCRNLIHCVDSGKRRARDALRLLINNANIYL